ncbi:hypothetical protein OM076_13460 [Solirubrobacter ginsenosidimutans]|uniref:CheR-type methyltransferase domain-containing protein n=1 Tax=Solirubrobacter ginsenosidimutans TaxID=490573 RepID=A0A9X3S0G6_9ACTN|nr:CheR family methyltransferase [Solirubrobacter ginsenosidimutans]MDA0161279.1 hypothetical protein [Solirubrobacter ginsenosidimutans]
MPRVVVGSEFFLDLDRWQTLERTILPELVARRPALRAWSAGCHLGKEPYSLAILLDELAPGGGHDLMATDFDARLVERARAGGPFSEHDVDRVSAEQRARYFAPGGPPFSVAPWLVSTIAFGTHDLRRDPYASDFDLILYRDVQPFFDDAVNRDVLRRLSAALRDGGVLFVGSTDTVRDPASLGLRPREPGFFVRSA